MKLLKSTVFLLTLSIAQAQNAPPSNAAATSNNIPAGFEPYATIHIIIDSASAPEGSAEALAIQRGFDSAAQAYSSNGNSFTYSFMNSNDACPVLGNNEYYVTDASFADPTKYGENDAGSIYFNSVYGTDVVSNGTIYMDYAKLTSSEAEQYGATHEISHDFYLGDCPTGCGQSSIMSYEINANDPPFLSPQPDDWISSYDYSQGGWDEGPGPEW